MADGWCGLPSLYTKGLASALKHARLILESWEDRVNNNLIVHYMYRDASNNKRHGSVILRNDEGIAPSELYKAIKSAFEYMNLFPDVVIFDPDVLGWPSLFFFDHNLADDDVSCHELTSIQITDEAPTLGISAGDIFCKLTK